MSRVLQTGLFSKKLEVHTALAPVGDSFHPGQDIPESGFYECDAGDSHRWSVNVKGHRFPPLPDGCKSHGWVFKNTTAAAEALHGVSKAVPGVETSQPP